MATVYLSGSSDDLIEVDGDLTEEFYAEYGKTNVIRFSDGTYILMTYNDDGEWILEVEKLGNGTTFEKRGVVRDEGYDAYGFANYSEVITLTGDIRGVRLGVRS